MSNNSKVQSKRSTFFDYMVSKGGIYASVAISTYFLVYFASLNSNLWLLLMLSSMVFCIARGLWFNLLHDFSDALQGIFAVFFTKQGHRHSHSSVVPITSRVVIDKKLYNDALECMRRSFLYILLIFAVIIITRILHDYLEAELRPRLISDIRKNLFKLVKDREFEFFVENSNATIMDKFDEIVDRTRSVLSFGVNTCVQFVSSIMLFIFIVISEGATVQSFIYFLMFFTAFLGIFAYLIFTSRFVMQLSKLATKDSKVSSLVISKLWDSVFNIYNVKVNSAEEYEDSYFGKFQDYAKRVFTRYILKLNSLHSFCMFVGYGIQVFGLFYIAVMFWNPITEALNSSSSRYIVSNTINNDRFRSLIRYSIVAPSSLIIFHHVEHFISNFFEFLEEATFIFEDVDRMADCIFFLLRKFSKKRELDILLSSALKPKASCQCSSYNDHAKSLEFVHFSFHFSDKNKKLFNDFNLKVAAGEKIGIVGSSGAGKSTLLSLLLGLHSKYDGAILIGGKEQRDTKTCCLHKMITVIPQTTFLFNRTVYENIIVGRPDASAEEVYQCSKKAFCHDFILSLDGGYNFIVGNTGEKLSGGQRQRIMIARAFLKGGGILLVDEATSALDSLTEKYVGESMKELFVNKTVVRVAHRVHTLQSMDRIIVLDKGRVIEEGSMTELIEKKEYFYRLWSHMEER